MACKGPSALLFHANHTASCKRNMPEVSSSPLRAKSRTRKEVKVVSVKELRSQLAAKGVSCSGMSVTAVRERARSESIAVHIACDGSAVQEYGDLDAEEVEREMEQLRKEHINPNTREGYSSSQRRMIQWWLRQDKYKEYIDGDGPNAKVRDIGSFPVKGFTSFLNAQVDVNLSHKHGKRMLISKNALNNYRSAFSNFFDETEPPTQMSKTTKKVISQTMKALKKRHVREARAGFRKAKEGKDALSFSVLKGMSNICLEEGMFYEHAYSMLCWDLMCRSNNVGDLTLEEHMSYANDCMEILFSGDKMHGDGEGDFCKEPKHIYANTLYAWKCVFCALGLYCLSNPQVGVNSPNLFPGSSGSQSKRFHARFTEGLNHPRIVALFKQHGLSISDVSVHSFRKGAGTFCTSGCTGGPSIVSIIIRAGWELGGVLERYLRYMEAGDQFVGRVVSGLPLNDVHFRDAPPHFKVEGGDVGNVIAAVQSLFPFTVVREHTYKLAEILLASVLHHLPQLIDGDSPMLPVGSKGRKAFLETALMRSEEFKELRKFVVVEDPDWDGSITGVPAWHISLKAVLETLQTVKDIPSRVAMDIATEMEKRDRQAGTVSLFILQQELDKQRESLKKDMQVMLDNRFGRKDGVEEAEQVCDRYWWAEKGSNQPTNHALPQDFVLQRKGRNVKTAFGMFWQGHEDHNDTRKRRIPALRAVPPRDFAHQQSRRDISGWRVLFDGDLRAACVRGSDAEGAYSRAVEAVQQGRSATSADVNTMFDALCPVVTKYLGKHKRKEEAHVMTVVHRRYEFMKENAIN